ncbi:uncharacterized protein LOC128385638 isoform X2 [Panonychus citri]|uniref:uncharacterized protein LOC128385638 isoform X2 n=1 Tax=Panonychus citri TaxID=50023 RepID=UPI0023079295|nr:uncharacterized protein LOC128385638 isoform X2 [Panonychus citri]
MVWSTLINCQQQEDESTINERNNSIILTDYNQLMSRLGVTTSPGYPSYLDDLNQIELEAPIKGYLNKLASRKWFTPLWLNSINSKGSWRTSYCILRANKLYYYQNQLGLGFDKKHCGQINLDYYDVCEQLTNTSNIRINLKDDNGSKFTFLIYSSLANVSSSSYSSQSRHIFAADSALEMFKWISSIQNAIKDARVNRKGPGRRRHDKSKSGANGDAVDASSKHKTAPADGLAFNSDRIEPISILHCEQKNRPRGPKGRRLPGRNNLHSTILNGTSTSDLLDNRSSSGTGCDHLFAINESLSLESSTDMTNETSITNHHHNFNHQRRPRTSTNDTLDTDGGDDIDNQYGGKKDDYQDGEGGNYYDSVIEEPSRRIIGMMSKMKMEEDEETRKEKSLMMLNGYGKGDLNLPSENNLIFKSNGDSPNHHYNNSSRLSNGGGGKMTNGYSPAIKSTTTTTTTTSPSLIKRFHDNNFNPESKDLKRQLNAIFSNNNQHQQLTINLGESIVTIDQMKLTQCLKEICPTLITSNTLLEKSSSISSSLSNFDPKLKSLIKEIESLKDVKKSKHLTTKIEGIIGKLVTLSNDYSKSIESFDQYNDEISKLINSLSTLVNQSKITSTGPISSSSPSSLSPPSSPRLVNPNKLLNAINK